MSKVSNDTMRKAIDDVLKGATDKKREFVETIELQIGLKNYDPQKDKRFAGNIKLPHIPRPKMRVCVLGDAFHCEKAAAMGLEFKNADGLKNFNKNKKLIKKFGARATPSLALGVCVEHSRTQPYLPACLCGLRGRRCAVRRATQTAAWRRTVEARAARPSASRVSAAAEPCRRRSPTDVGCGQLEVNEGRTVAEGHGGRWRAAPRLSHVPLRGAWRARLQPYYLPAVHAHSLTPLLLRAPPLIHPSQPRSTTPLSPPSR